MFCSFGYEETWVCWWLNCILCLDWIIYHILYTKLNQGLMKTTECMQKCQRTVKVLSSLCRLLLVIDCCMNYLNWMLRKKCMKHQHIIIFLQLDLIVELLEYWLLLTVSQNIYTAGCHSTHFSESCLGRVYFCLLSMSVSV